MLAPLPPRANGKRGLSGSLSREARTLSPARGAFYIVNPSVIRLLCRHNRFATVGSVYHPRQFKLNYFSDCAATAESNESSSMLW